MLKVLRFWKLNVTNFYERRKVNKQYITFIISSYEKKFRSEQDLNLHPTLVSHYYPITPSRITMINEVKFYLSQRKYAVKRVLKCVSLMKTPFEVCRSVLMYHWRTSTTKHQSSAFKMSPFSAIDFSFVTKALRTGQRNYQEKFTSEWWGDRASE